MLEGGIHFSVSDYSSVWCSNVPTFVSCEILASAIVFVRKKPPLSRISVLASLISSDEGFSIRAEELSREFATFEKSPSTLSSDLMDSEIGDSFLDSWMLYRYFYASSSFYRPISPSDELSCKAEA